MKLRKIAELIEKTAPKELAYHWDNVGLLVGSYEKDVKKALITLDTNLSTVREAAENNCDMIISHHPILFGGIKRVDVDTPVGEMLNILIKNDISVYAAHTNMDTAENGINSRLAELFGICEPKILEFHTERSDAGLGRYGRLKNPITFAQLCGLTKQLLKTPSLRAAGDMDKEIKSLCVASGSCSEAVETAIKKECDAIITGDMKYHETIDYTEQGMCIIDAGHYPTETIVMDIFADILSETGLELIKSRNEDIFKFI